MLNIAHLTYNNMHESMHMYLHWYVIAVLLVFYIFICTPNNYANILNLI